MKSSFVQENLGTLVSAILFFVVIFWKSLSTRPQAANLDNLIASIPSPASQVEALDVEIFLSSQGSL
jgi:type II secretory pathway component PulF